MQIPCVYIPGPAPAVSVANSVQSSGPVKEVWQGEDTGWWSGVLLLYFSIPLAAGLISFVPGSG
jgi:hypothetical protein